uniref:Uncharacterized protein n=1 Tax=Anguilla anguilla TaxID=7936 RepID=A0A0E9V1J3_ANGAN
MLGFVTATFLAHLRLLNACAQFFYIIFSLNLLIQCRFGSLSFLLSLNSLSTKLLDLMVRCQLSVFHFI